MGIQMERYEQLNDLMETIIRTYVRTKVARNRCDEIADFLGFFTTIYKKKELSEADARSIVMPVLYVVEKRASVLEGATPDEANRFRIEMTKIREAIDATKQTIINSNRDYESANDSDKSQNEKEISCLKLSDRGVELFQKWMGEQPELSELGF